MCWLSDRLPFLCVAAPDFVPVNPTRRVRKYSSPPRRVTAPSGLRPLPQPQAKGMGRVGPDQGYAYRLAGQFDLSLGGVHRQDAVAGCVEIATKRAAMFGRAPMVHDMEVAFTVFGFLDADADDDLVEARRRWFTELDHPHQYRNRRNLVDMVDDEVLRKSPEAINAAYQLDWRRNLSV